LSQRRCAPTPPYQRATAATVAIACSWRCISSPRGRAGEVRLTRAALDCSHCLAVLSNGDLYAWGASGRGDPPRCDADAEVLTIDVSGVDGGGAPPSGGEDGEVTVAAAAAAPSGGVVHDHGGALGLQLLGAQHSLVRHGALDKHRIWTVSCGDGPHAIALTHPSAGGRAIVWGRNSSGELACVQVSESWSRAAPRLGT